MLRGFLVTLQLIRCRVQAWLLKKFPHQEFEGLARAQDGSHYYQAAKEKAERKIGLSLFPLSVRTRRTAPWRIAPNPQGEGSHFQKM
jgi:hypothetical protein